MGLKSGSRNAGLDDDEDETEQDVEREETTRATEDAQDVVRTEQIDDPPVTVDAEDSEPVPTQERAETTETTDDGDRPAMSSIPYKLRRDKVNEGREQVPYFLREDVIEAEDEFQDTLEELLGEDVYKSDYREAAMVVAQRNPELVAEVLREWGYDLDTE